MEYKIRKAKKEDLKFLKKVYSKAGRDEIKTQYPGEKKEELQRKVSIWSKEIFKDFKKEVNSRKVLWLVAEVEEKIVGFANARIFSKKYSLLDRNYVEREYRGKGLGKEFIRQRIDWLKSKGIELVMVKTFLKNSISKNNLKKFGFNQIEVIMEKKLK